MEKIILKQHSPIVILGELGTRQQKKKKSRSTGIWWAITGIIILIAVVLAIVYSLKKEAVVAELVDAQKT